MSATNHFAPIPLDYTSKNGFQVLILAGVSGVGKSFLMQLITDLSIKNGVPAFTFDADSLHTKDARELANKSGGGQEFSREYRLQWIASYRKYLANVSTRRALCISACSSLTKEIRELLLRDKSVAIVWLEADRSVLNQRLKKRDEEGGHFIPAKNLDLQLFRAEVPTSEELPRVVKISANGTPEETLSLVERSLQFIQLEFNTT